MFRQIAFIFHCEFSQKRGPKLCRYMRERDRQINGLQNFPKLFFPEVYVMRNGYRQFHASYPELCDGGYVSMFHDSKKRKPSPQQDELSPRPGNTLWQLKTRAISPISQITIDSAGYRTKSASPSSHTRQKITLLENSMLNAAADEDDFLADGEVASLMTKATNSRNTTMETLRDALNVSPICPSPQLFPSRFRNGPNQRQ